MPSFHAPWRIPLVRHFWTEGELKSRNRLERRGFACDEGPIKSASRCKNPAIRRDLVLIHHSVRCQENGIGSHAHRVGRDERDEANSLNFFVAVPSSSSILDRDGVEALPLRNTLELSISYQMLRPFKATAFLGHQFDLRMIGNRLGF